MTTTPAPNDIDTLKALLDAMPEGPWRVAQSQPHPGIRTAAGWEVVWATYADTGPKVLEFIAAMRNALPALLDELATERRQGASMASFADGAIRQIGEERDAAREELAKTSAELDHLRKVLDAAKETTAAAQQIVTAALAAGTARINPATTAEPAQVCVHTHCQLDQHETVNVAEATAPITVTHGGLVPAPDTTAEPAHTVWDHYGPCGYCGAQAGPCLNVDNSDWPTERMVPAPKPHPSRQLADTTAEPAAG